MVTYTGQGDPHRSMALLWGATTPSGRGPRQGLSVELIVTKAIAIADSDGLDEVSMRKVGAGLGKTAMALYTYIPGKAELIDLMVDRVQAELPTAYPTETGWRTGLSTYARETWALYQRHPWLLRISASRAVLGPNEMGAYDAALSIVADLGLTGLDMTRVISVLSAFVRGAAQTMAETREAERETGISENDWWYARSAALESSVDSMADRYPTITRIGQDQGFALTDPDAPYLEQRAADTFEIGLAVLLDGLETYLDILRVVPNRSDSPQG